MYCDTIKFYYSQVTKVLKKKYIIDIFLFFLKYCLNLLKNDIDITYNEFNINLYLSKQC